MRPAITRSCPGSARAMEPATRLKGWAWTSAPRVWPWVRAPARPSARRTPGVGIWHRGIAAGGSWGRLSGAGRQQRQRSGPGTQSPGRAGPPPQIIGCVQHVIKSKFCRDSHVGIAHNFAHPDFRSWLQADYPATSPVCLLYPQLRTFKCRCPLFARLRLLSPQQRAFPVVPPKVRS